MTSLQKNVPNENTKSPCFHYYTRHLLVCGFNSIFVAIEGWVLLVTGIHEDATEEDYYDLFSEFGKVKNLKLPTDHRTAYLKGYAFVEYDTLKGAKDAVSGIGGRVFMDYTLECSFAFVKPPVSERRHHDKRYT